MVKFPSFMDSRVKSESLVALFLHASDRHKHTKKRKTSSLALFFGISI